jgi:hypothetical protein
LKEYCKSFELDQAYIGRYYQQREIFVRFCRGIFYAKSAREVDMRYTKYNYPVVVAK